MPESQKTPPQASMLWRLELKFSKNKPADWYQMDISKQAVSDLISAFLDYEKNPNNEAKSLVYERINNYNSDFEFKDTNPAQPQTIPAPPEKVTISPDMDIATVIETLYPVAHGITHIQDLFDAKLPELPKSSGKSQGYYKPAIFDDVLNALRIPNINVLIKGPAGSGKSLMAKELSKELSLEYYAFSCSGSMRYGHVIGSDKLYTDPETNQTVSKFELTELMKAFQRPCLILLDECFSLAADILIGLNGLFEPSCRTIETKAGKIELHPDCKVIVAANSDGRNIERNYSGAKRVDSSTLDRFITFKIDYSKRVETSILNSLPKIHREWIKEKFYALRKAVSANNIQFDVSTRRLDTCCRMVAGGFKPVDAFKVSLLGQLSDTELRKLNISDLEG